VIPVLASGTVRIGCRDVLSGGRGGAARGAGEPDKATGPAIEHPLEVSRDADRPRQGSGAQPDPRLHLVHQFQRVAAGTIPLIDHRDDQDPTMLA
jgi:hypothetical protein